MAPTEFSQLRALIMYRLDTIDSKIAELTGKVDTAIKDIAGLKVRAAMAGGAVGTIMGAIATYFMNSVSGGSGHGR